MNVSETVHLLLYCLYNFSGDIIPRYCHAHFFLSVWDGVNGVASALLGRSRCVVSLVLYFFIIIILSFLFFILLGEKIYMEWVVVYTFKLVQYFSVEKNSQAGKSCCWRSEPQPAECSLTAMPLPTHYEDTANVIHNASATKSMNWLDYYYHRHYYYYYDDYDYYCFCYYTLPWLPFFFLCVLCTHISLLRLLLLRLLLPFHIVKLLHSFFSPHIMLPFLLQCIL